MDKVMQGPERPASLMSARQMTDEIERATTPVDTESLMVEKNWQTSQQIPRQAEVELGRKAIFSMGAGEAQTATGEIQTLVAEENGYLQEGLAPGANVVGNESQVEAEQRLADDQEDMKTEEEPGWAHDLMTRNHENLTKETVRQLTAEVRAKATHPAELVKLRRQGMHAALAVYGRKLGDRN